MARSTAFSLAKRIFPAALALLLTSVAPAQTIRELPLEKGRGYSGIAVGADGTAYIAEFDANAIAIVKPGSAVVEARTISRASGPRDLQFGPDGNLWFVENTAGNIGVMRPDGTMLDEWSTHCPPSGALASGPDDAMWFTEVCSDSEFVTKITTTGTMSRYQIGKNGDTRRALFGLVEGPDGNVWFVEQLGNAIGVLTPSTGLYAEFAIRSPAASPFFIFVGPDGNLWFPELTSRAKLGRIDVHGAITEFDWPADELASLAIGSDDSFWGIDGAKGIWRIDVGGSGMVPTRFPSKPYSISSSWMTRGVDGNVWFSETTGCAVGRIDMDSVFNENFESCP